MSYQIGDKPRLSCTFRDGISRALMDPTNVRLRVKKPDDTETVYVYGVNAELVRESVGVYHVDLPLTAANEWWYRWEGAGAAGGVLEKPLQVDQTNFTSLS